ncbi:MAG: hypothetical protein HKN59_07560 [Gammaproteobacteria bacterium]|nr:hypothetical protein [Gammaproteobacteria bacterium]
MDRYCPTPGDVHSAGRAAATRIARVLLAALVLMAPAPVSALAAGEFVAAELKGDGWSASNVTFQLALTDNSDFSGRVVAASLRIPELQIELRDVTIDCPLLALNRAAVSCADARISLLGLPLDSPRLTATFYYEFDTGATKLELPRVRIAGGQASVVFSGQQNWRADITTTGLSMAKLKAAARGWFAIPLPDGVDGKLDSRLRLEGGDRIERANGRASFYAISGSNEAGSLASENLGASIDFDARRDDTDWLADLTLSESRGQAYFLPVFIDFALNPLVLSASVVIPADGDWLVDFKTEQAGIGAFTGELAIDGRNGELRQAAVTSGRAVLPGAYDVYLQPFLVGTSADSLETAGAIEVKADFSGPTLRALELGLTEIYLDDRRGRFALYGLEGNVNWQGDAIGRSLLSWQGGYVYKIGVGAAKLTLDTGRGNVLLVEPAVIPVLDGRLRLSRFELATSESDLPDLEFEADIEQIGLRALTRALGWPPFSGTLSGRIPRMRLANNAITVAGAMSAEVFDGSITIDNLYISEPFGVLPQATADVTIRTVDLAALSSTFSFGHMEGRLDGELKQLRMLGFSPVSFGAKLYTTPNDRSRHRISQQAIENISDLGGAGATAVLSRGLLRFFEDFAYDKIGWSCVLEDEICSMSGVAPAPNGGYYIVKGKGLPRINVIGYRSRVSWPTLVAKLRNINASSASVRP